MLQPGSSPAATAIRARWILTAESPPIRDGLLVVHQGRIASVGPTPAEHSETLLEDIVVLPAFVNSHTHLEFSSLAQPLGSAGMPFPDWIRLVIAWRQRRDQDAKHGSAERQRAIRMGVEETDRSGACAIGEIATAVLSDDELARSGLQGILFLERIGLSPARTNSVVAETKNFLTSSTGNASLRMGISPHAPYTVHPDLLHRLVQLSSQQHVPVAMHLAETVDELQLLRDGRGGFRDLLDEWNVWVPGAIRNDARPLDYLKLLALAHRALVVHGNYLDDEERQYVADLRDRLTIVYCPRTHAYFRHSPYPLADLVTRGARVALGTDSRASNPDLDMLSEIRIVANCHPDVAPEEILRMGTLHGAFALGVERDLGSLRVGKQARYLTLNLPNSELNNPYNWLTGN